MGKPVVQLGSGVLHNDDLADKAAKWDDDQIFKRVGIRSRPIVKEGEDVVSMATIAASKVVTESGLKLEDFQSVICSSCTANRATPSIASDVLKNLLIERGDGSLKGAGNLPPAFDINAACSGFLYGLQLAYDQLAQDPRPVLLLTSEVISPLINYDDPSTAYVFGDASTATVIYHDDNAASNRLAYSRPILRSTPDFENALRAERHSEPERALFMNGIEVARSAKKEMCRLGLAACEAEPCLPSELTWIIAHQANQRILDGVAWGLELPKEKLISTLKTTGNTSSSSVPICLTTHWNEIFKSETKSLLVAFGAGFTVASSIVHPTNSDDRREK